MKTILIVFVFAGLAMGALTTNAVADEPAVPKDRFILITFDIRIPAVKDGDYILDSNHQPRTVGLEHFIREPLSEQESTQLGQKLCNKYFHWSEIGEDLFPRQHGSYILVYLIDRFENGDLSIPDGYSVERTEDPFKNPGTPFADVEDCTDVITDYIQSLVSDLG